MKDSCAILVFHYESFEFLIGCIREIRKFKHPDIEQKIIIADQSGVWTHRKVNYTFSGNDDIIIARMPQIDSGYSIDWVFRNMDIKTKYFCTLDCDAFPIHKNWLYAPIKLIKDNGYSFVGGYAGIDDLYKEHGSCFIMNQFYRVGKTSVYKKLAMNAGFVRYNDRCLSGFKYSNVGWDGYSDCGVVAHWYEDRALKNNKFGLAVNKYIGIVNEHKWGVIIDDLVFHFGQSNNMKDVDDPKRLGEEYLFYSNRIKKEGLDSGIIDELIAKTKNAEKNTERKIWDGVNRKIKSPSIEANNEIDKFKNAK